MHAFCRGSEPPDWAGTGRPSRAQALDSLIEYVCSHDDVWVTSVGAIASYVRGLGLPPRSVERPNPADF